MCNCSVVVVAPSVNVNIGLAIATLSALIPEATTQIESEPGSMEPLNLQLPKRWASQLFWSNLEDLNPIVSD